MPVRYHYNKDEYPKLLAAFESMCGLEAYQFDPIATELLKESKAKAAGT